MFELATLVEQCSANVEPIVMLSVIKTESSHNPYAIGVVNGAVKQPKTLQEAVNTAKALHAANKNFSMGLAQINRYNLAKYNLNYETVFDPCNNIRAASYILSDCYSRALKLNSNHNDALRMAFSCYYSGNFSTGFRADFKGQLPYVEKVWNALGINSGFGSQLINGKATYATNPIKLIANSKSASQLANNANLQNNFDVNAINSNINTSNNFANELDYSLAGSQAPAITATVKAKVVNSWDIFNDF
jgi:type IV secretion system protein VirB1